MSDWQQRIDDFRRKSSKKINRQREEQEKVHQERMAQIPTEIRKIQSEQLSASQLFSIKRSVLLSIAEIESQIDRTAFENCLKEQKRVEGIGEEQEKRMIELSKNLEILLQLKKEIKERENAMRLLNLNWNDINSVVENKDLAIPKARAELQIDESKLALAIVGMTKAGKSTFINSLMKKRSKQSGAAKTGIVEIKHDEIPQKFYWKNLCFYDILGMGTTNNPAHEYFLEKRLYAYDFLIMVLTSTPKTEEIAFIREALQYKIPMILIRSQMDKTMDQYLNQGKISPDLSEQEQAQMALQEYRPVYIGLLRNYLPEVDHFGETIFYQFSFIITMAKFESATFRRKSFNGSVRKFVEHKQTTHF